MVLPLGLLKANADGVDGAELQFLGKSMPVNTALLPTASAMLGATAGVALGRHGNFNELGLQERQNRNEAVIDRMIREVGGEDNLPAKEAKRVERLRADSEKAGKRKDYLSNMPEFTKRFTRKNPVLTGLALGGAGLVGGTLIGNELERRRRDANLQSQEIGF